MKTGNIAIVSHVNPFSSGSGQVQRVYNTLLALALDWNRIIIYTLEAKQSNPERENRIIQLNPGVQIKYLQQSSWLKLLKPVFYFLPYLGFGKPSNWILPFIFKQLVKQDFKQYDCVLFEYWYLYKLAGKIKSPETMVVCDTHNILLGSFKEYIWSKKLPAFYKKYLVNRYRYLEFNKALKNSFDALIAINKEEEAIYKNQFPGKKILYCPMGVKLPAYFPAKIDKPKGSYTVAYYGGLSNPRNTAAAIQVYTALIKSSQFENKNFAYKIIGSNPPKVLSNLVLSNPAITLTGFVEDLSTVLSDVDLAVIPFEGKFGFRSRIIELMYFGIPVLTSPDAVWGMGFTAGVNIFNYNPGDDIANEIMRLLNDRDNRERVACNAKKYVEQEFTFEATYKNLSKELKQLAS